MAILVEMCKRILAKGDLPEGHVLEKNIISKNLCRKVGFSSIGKATILILHFCYTGHIHAGMLECRL